MSSGGTYLNTTTALTTSIGQLRFKRRAGTSAALALLVALATGCGAGPVSVKRLSPETAYSNLSENALSAGTISNSTRNTLRRNDLLTRFQKKPEEAIGELRSRAFGDEPTQGELAALSETSFAYAMQSGDRRHFLASALYSFALLFPENREDDLNGIDPRVRIAIDVYNAAIVRAFASQDGETVELRGGEYELPFGTIEIAFDESSLDWADGRLGSFIPATELEVQGLRNRYRRWGIGAALAGLAEESGESEKPKTAGDYVPEQVRTPVTALLRLGQARDQLRYQSLSATLDLYTPTDPEEILVGRHVLPLESEPTATLAVALAETQPWRTELTRFLGGVIPGASTRSNVRLTALEPPKPDSIPVIFVHGTYSSSSRWANMVNDLNADKNIRDRFDFYFFSYDSGNPISYSGSQLRRELDALHAHLRELNPDRCIENMVVIGHSQGGLLTKMTAIDSGTTFWDAISRKPFDQVRISKKNRQLIREAMFFDARPYVTRVVFIATPHQGSYMASSGFVQRMARRLITIPADLASLSADMLQLREDPDLMLNMERVSTSIDNMSPGSRALEVLASVPIKEGISAHSIIAVKNDGPLEDGVDGVVAYKSAHIDGVESELVVKSPHSCQDNPHTINEVQRILELQAAAVTCGEHRAAPPSDWPE